jgi:hypothetical protein
MNCETDFEELPTGNVSFQTIHEKRHTDNLRIFLCDEGSRGVI